MARAPTTRLSRRSRHGTKRRAATTARAADGIGDAHVERGRTDPLGEHGGYEGDDQQYPGEGNGAGDQYQRPDDLEGIVWPSCGDERDQELCLDDPAHEHHDGDAVTETVGGSFLSDGMDSHRGRR